MYSGLFSLEFVQFLEYVGFMLFTKCGDFFLLLSLQLALPSLPLSETLSIGTLDLCYAHTIFSLF